MADYKGKLTGQQIDELPGKLDTLSQKVGELTTEEQKIFDTVTDMARAAYKHVTDSFVRVPTNEFFAYSDGNIDVNTGKIKEDPEYEVFGINGYYFPPSATLPVLTRTFGKDAVASYYNGYTLGEYQGSISLAEYDGKQINIWPSYGSPTSMILVSCRKDKASDFYIRDCNSVTPSFKKLYAPTLSTSNDSYAYLSDWGEERADCTYVYTVPISNFQFAYGEYYVKHSSKYSGEIVAYFTVDDSVKTDNEGYASNFFSIYAQGGMPDIVGELKVKPGLRYILCYYRGVIILQELNTLTL